jgi:repressor LexA
MRSKNLTLKQVNVVTTIRNFGHIHGYPPTVRELAHLLTVARGTVVQHLDSLERKGVLRRQPRKPRTLEILQAA